MVGLHHGCCTKGLLVFFEQCLKVQEIQASAAQLSTEEQMGKDEAAQILRLIL